MKTKETAEHPDEMGGEPIHKSDGVVTETLKSSGGSCIRSRIAFIAGAG